MVLGPFNLVDLASPTYALDGEVLGLRRLAINERLLSVVGRVAVDAPPVAVQQVRQRIFVVHIGLSRRLGTVCKTPRQPDWCEA